MPKCITLEEYSVKDDIASHSVEEIKVIRQSHVIMQQQQQQGKKVLQI